MDKILPIIKNNLFVQKKKNFVLCVDKVKIKSANLKINGYKHSMVQIIAYAIASNQKTCIIKPPMVTDTFVFCSIINSLGGTARISGKKLFIDPTNINISEIPANLSELIHGSLYLMPALIAKVRSFKFFSAGGCKIGDNGSRPFEHILKTMAIFGVNIKNSENSIIGQVDCLNDEVVIDIMQFSNSKTQLSGPLVGGATKTAILLSSKCKKVTILNPFYKLDVLDLINFMKQIGKTVIISENKIEIINGVQKNIIQKFKLTQCISEIMTYITLAVLNNITIKFKNLNKNNIQFSLNSEIEYLKQMNVNLIWDNNDLIVCNQTAIKPITIDVLPNTIMSDSHPFFALICLNATDKSKITEYVWDKRFMYVDNLKALGASINHQKNYVIITPSKLQKKDVVLKGKDVRTSAVTLIAGITSCSNLQMIDFEHIFRGYDNLVKNMKKLGVTLSLKEI